MIVWQADLGGLGSHCRGSRGPSWDTWGGLRAYLESFQWHVTRCADDECTPAPTAQHIVHDTAVPPVLHLGHLPCNWLTTSLSKGTTELPELLRRVLCLLGTGGKFRNDTYVGAS